MKISLQDRQDVFCQTLHITVCVWMGAQGPQYVRSSFTLKHITVLRGYNNRNIIINYLLLASVKNKNILYLKRRAVLLVSLAFFLPF